jgi:uncharacterized protein YndB with AHSA1/START domain
MTEFAVKTSADTLRLERLLPGPIERVWAYLTESDKRATWLASGPMDLTVGGRMEFRFRHADLSSHAAPIPELYKAIENGHLAHGEVLRCEPPHLLTFTWLEGHGPASEVTIALTESGAQVRLVLTHGLVTDPGEIIGLAGGWHAHLDFLLDRLNGDEPPPFWPVYVAIDAAYRERFAAA